MHFVSAKTILNSNGINLYRGCTHGCIYCDSRSLCYHTPIPFEDIEVKQNAIELLEDALIHKRKKCMVGTGSMCDPYMHCEKDLCMTQKTLELLERHGFGAALQTKSDMVLRDLDIIEAINRKTKFVLQMTVTTADDNLCRIIEPNVCPTSRRFEVLNIFREKGIPEIPRSHLDTDAAPGSVAYGIEAPGEKPGSIGFAPGRYKLLVRIAFFSPQAEIAMCDGKERTQGGGCEQIRHHHGINAPAHGQQESGSRLAEGGGKVPQDSVETLLHQSFLLANV